MKRPIPWLCVLSSLVLFPSSVPAQVSPVEEEVAMLSELRKEDPTYNRLFNHFGDPRELYERHLDGTEAAKNDWQRRRSELRKLTNFGSIKTLAILPLIDWKVAHDGLAGESGVAYLVKTDHATVLFDVGLNAQAEDPSPLLRNMRQLAVDLRQIDAIVISHPHGDHTGGGKWARKGSFSLTDNQIDLGDIRAYTPVAMQYPGIEVKWTEDPTVIAPGVATIGVIANHYFFMGEIPEQALAVNLEGKGIVVVVGCGHQTLKKIVDRAEALFDAPLIGVLGGLHYPVTKAETSMCTDTWPRGSHQESSSRSRRYRPTPTISRRGKSVSSASLLMTAAIRVSRSSSRPSPMPSGRSLLVRRSSFRHGTRCRNYAGEPVGGSRGRLASPCRMTLDRVDR